VALILLKLTLSPLEIAGATRLPRRFEPTVRAAA
jgi:hypothetical protein